MLDRIDLSILGYNPDVGTSEEDMIDAGGSLVYPNAAGVASLVSTSDADGAAVSEVQSLFNDATGGTFTITFSGQTTAAIAYDAAAAAVEAALELLSNITDVSVTGAGTSGDPWLITFVDPSGPVAEITTNDASLIGGTSTIATTVAGKGGSVDKVLLTGWAKDTWEYAEEVVTLDGTDAAVGTQQWERIISASSYNIAAAGVITVTVGSQVQATILAGRDRAGNGYLTIPLGRHGQVTAVRATPRGTDTVALQLYRRRYQSGLWEPLGPVLSVAPGNENQWFFPPGTSGYMKVGALTDLVLRATGAAGGDPLDANFDITLRKNY